MAFRVGARFIPTDLGLVRRFLRDKVEKNESGYIKTMNVYKDDPWRLDHDPNPLFHRNQWYYFVPRTKRGGSTANRSVPSNGESEGGKWKSTDEKTKIFDEKKVLFGYRQSLVYNKTVDGEPVKTDWHMTEYSLHNGEADQFQDLVLCLIRYQEKKDKKVNLVPQVENNNIVLPNYEREEEADFANQQQQQQEQDTPILLLPPPTTQSNNNNNNDIMMISNQHQQQQQNPWDVFDFDGLEDETIGYDELMKILDEDDDLTTQQQREEERLQLLQQIPQVQDSGAGQSHGSV